MTRLTRSPLILVALAMSLAVAPATAQQGTYGPTLPVSETPGNDVVLEAPPGVPSALLTAASTATRTYPTIRSAEAEVRAARYELRGAKWLRFPSLTVEALAVTRGSSTATQNGITANAVVEQPLLTFGRIGGTIDRAEAIWLVRMISVDEVARDVALQVTQSYYDIALSARRQAVLEDGIAQHEVLIDTISRRVSQEISATSDLDLARSRIAQLQQELAVAKAQRTASYARLTELVGPGAANLGNVPSYDPGAHHPSDAGAIDRALACDPKIQRLRAETLVARADERVAKAQMFPQLVGQVSSNEITGTRAGLALRAQTGNGLSQLSALESARQRVAASEFAVSTAEREVREALRLDFVTNGASRDRARVGAAATTSSQSVTESYKRQFVSGRRTWLDVMNAVREATTLEMSVADAEVGAMASNARIWLRTCGWQPRPPQSTGMDGGK